jgi:transketolase
MVYQSIVDSDILKNQGVNACVVKIHTIKAMDESLIKSASNKTEIIVTVEKHSIINGLGSAVAEVLTEDCKTKHFRLRLNDTFPAHGP